MGTAEGPVWTSACVSISLSPALSRWMVFLRSPKDWDGKKEVVGRAGRGGPRVRSGHPKRMIDGEPRGKWGLSQGSVSPGTTMGAHELEDMEVSWSGSWGALYGAGVKDWGVLCKRLMAGASALLWWWWWGWDPEEEGLG